MMSNWQIGESGTAVILDDVGRGEVTLTVTNTAATQDRAVLTVTALDGAAESWFAIEEPQKAVPPGQSVTYLCKVQVPAETAPAVYACQFVVYSADRDPGETSATSRRITVEKKLPATPPPKTPWWIFAVAAAVVVAVIGVIAFLVLPGDDDDLANEEAPTVSGEPVVLQPLAATPGKWSDDGLEFTFAWQRCDASGEGCSVIDGATLPAYAIGVDDIDRTLRVEVTATKGDQSAKAVSAPVGPVTDVGGPPVPVTDVRGDNASVGTATLAKDFQVVRLTTGEPIKDCDPPIVDQSPNSGTLRRGEVVAISTQPRSPLIKCAFVSAEKSPFLSAEGVGPIAQKDVSGMTKNLTQEP
jgi:hypothetical protein